MRVPHKLLYSSQQLTTDQPRSGFDLKSAAQAGGREFPAWQKRLFHQSQAELCLTGSRPHTAEAQGRHRRTRESGARKHDNLCPHCQNQLKIKVSWSNFLSFKLIIIHIQQLTNVLIIFVSSVHLLPVLKGIVKHICVCTYLLSFRELDVIWNQKKNLDTSLISVL